MNVFKAVEEFHEKFGQSIGDPFNQETINFRLSLVNEETRELYKEFWESGFGGDIPISKLNHQNITKELADILYVTIGFAVTFGLPLEEVFRRTHMSNMTKTGEKRGDGKVMKGDDYVAPALGDLFDE